MRRRVGAEAYQDAPEWFQRFLGEFNGVFSVAVDKAGAAPSLRVVRLVFETGASVSADAKPFPLWLPGRARAVWLGRLTPETPGATLPTSGCTVFSEVAADNRTRVRLVSGLATSTRYAATFVLLD